MNKAIIVTGTPGTGKTTISTKLAKDLKYDYIDVKKVIIKNKIYDSYDSSEKEYIIDEIKLKKFLEKLIEKSKNFLVIDSFMSQCINKKLVQLCIVTKTDISILNKRLKKRKYSLQKIRDNLDSEIFHISENEAIKNKHKIIEFDTTKQNLTQYKNLLKIIKSG